MSYYIILFITIYLIFSIINTYAINELLKSDLKSSYDISGNYEDSNINIQGDTNKNLTIAFTFFVNVVFNLVIIYLLFWGLSISNTKISKLIIILMIINYLIMFGFGIYFMDLIFKLKTVTKIDNNKIIINFIIDKITKDKITAFFALSIINFFVPFLLLIVNYYENKNSTKNKL